MKKFIASLATAAMLSTGAIALEAATVATHASVSAPSDYPDNAAAVQKVVNKINKLIANDKLTPVKVAKFIGDLKDARDAGVIGNGKFKKLKKKLKNAI